MGNSEIILYNTADGGMEIKVHLEDDTVWLTQDQMAQLYGKSRSTITEHIRNIFKEGELIQSEVSRKFRHTTQHGAIPGKFQNRDITCYNLDVIISVGYRVKSQVGTQFRQWATRRIHEYLVKGFTLDDARLKQEGGRSRYFDELLQRVRDIRSSERNLYQKITDIYATSIDYNADADLTQRFYATVQNKIHFAVHGKTAAELIAARADAGKQNMGLTNFKGNYLTSRDTGVAKNYLTEDELLQMNLIVSMFLDFAELQALNKKTMRMQDWIGKLDDFLRVSGRELLQNAGMVSHEEARAKALAQYELYRQRESEVYISDFDREVKKIIQLGDKSK